MAIDHDTVSNITRVLQSSADTFIPRVHPRKRVVPWWTKEIDRAFRDRRRGFQKLKRSFSAHDLESYRKKCNHVKMLIRRSKRESWRGYVSSMGQNTNSQEVWRKIRAVKGNNRTSHIDFIQEQGEGETLAECFAGHFRVMFSDGVPPFRNRHTLRSSYQCPLEPSELDTPISITELKLALGSTGGGSAGPDDINYLMLKNYPSLV